ncbi:MAG: right-handed parallel beta-helix repeat-containing protein [Treponema sp.]|uniref:beta strand repeat-containing protein n=1 Tax=Treponema sp. TaxID=166 RepID=UPI0025E644AB|nr:InlB B-repeat-containing protein [Treponema sp.]MBQ8680797.1 right-handed parallel beta-helix repeat-containing protein [Treponema sp.]
MRRNFFFFSFIILISLAASFVFFSCSQIEDALGISSPSLNVKITPPQEESEDYGYLISDIATCRLDFYRDSGKFYSCYGGRNSTISQNVSKGSYSIYAYGYDSMGTYIAKGRANASVSSGEENVKIQLEWDAAEKEDGEYVTVKFNTNGGLPIASIKVLKGSTITVPSTPAKLGYVFDGWYSKSDFTETFNFSTPITYNRTIFANWTGDGVVTVLYASSTGSDETGTGSEEAPFATLQKAIDKIQEINISSSDYTIYISGRITGLSNIPSNFAANMLSIEGKNNAASDILDGNASGTVLTINTEKNITLKNLTIQNGTCGLYLNGAGIPNTTVTLSNCNIKNNNSSSDGGGIRIVSCGSFSMQGGSISGNTSSGRGGGISISEMPIGVFIYDGTVISGNTAATYGGGIDYTVSGGGTLMISDCEISSNTATANSGGGIYADIGGDGTVITSNLTLKNNHADSGSGGGIYVTDSLNSFRMENGSISNNSAKNGGGVAVNTKSGATPLLYGVEIKDNTASENGGGIQVTTGKYLSILDCIVSGNTAASYGGGIYAPGKLTVTGSTITSNNANKGGGIYSVSSTAHLSINSGIITTNTASSDGGGIYSGGNLTITGGTISSNTAGLNGGGVFNSGTFIMTGGEIISNKTQEQSGAGIFNTDGASLEISNTAKISSNTSKQSGGGVFSMGSFTMKGGEISSNNTGSGHNGGGVCVYNNQGNTSTFTMSDGKITANTSTTGKGIAVLTNGEFTISGSAIITSNNDVYLKNDTYINIGGNLVESTAATITPQTYSKDRQILTEESEGLIATNYDKFALSNTSTYIINLLGKLSSIITENGKEYTEYGIDTSTDLIKVMDALNSYDINSENVYINLASDLTLDSAYTPYGYNPETGKETSNLEFKGIFDGCGHTITSGQVNSEIFNMICHTNAGIIQNIKLKIVSGVAISATEGNNTGEYIDFAGICYENSGLIRNCWVDLGTVTVTLWTKTGGISGGNTGIIENCVNTTNLICTYNQSSWAGIWGIAGGICGINDGTVKNCVNYGTITLPTKYSGSTYVNGVPGAIVGIQRTGATSTQNSYWRENCVYSNAEQTSTTNDMVYNSSLSDIRNGTFSGNGYFASNTNGVLTAGTASTSGTDQTLIYGTDLLSATNGYVSASSDSADLMTWVNNGSYAAVLDF